MFDGYGANQIKEDEKERLREGKGKITYDLQVEASDDDEISIS